MTTRQGWLVVLVSVAALVAGIWANRTNGDRGIDPREGVSRLMQLKLPDAAGMPQPMAQWKGKVIVANFWATWCPPCLEEMPGFERLSRKYAAKGVQFVGISIDSADKVREFAAKHDITYPLLIGDSSVLQLTDVFGNRMQGLPLTVVLDRAGVAQKVKLGRLAEEDLEATLLKLL